jgi:heat shock protein HslJ
MCSYELKGNELSFGQMAGTMMGCREAMDTDEGVSEWSLTNKDLQDRRTAACVV